MSAPDPSSDTPTVLRVLKGLLRPLVRMLIVQGVTAPALYRLLKTVYVDVAYEEFRIDGTAPTDSRVSLLTGVHRRDVRAIRSDTDGTWQEARSKTVTFTTVLGQWLTHPDYLDEAGHPRPLPRTGADGTDFESLVQRVSRDIRPRTVLDELMRQGLVEEDETSLLRVTGAALRGPGSGDDKIVFFAANVGDHLTAAAQNTLSDESPYLERAVFYNRLSTGSVDQIEATARRHAQDLLEKLNTQSSQLQRTDAKQGHEATERYRFGVYFFREATPDPKADKSNSASEGNAP
ncbi:MAG: DUF6502 family protein [Pseudomonadota bacterium]